MTRTPPSGERTDEQTIEDGDISRRGFMKGASASIATMTAAGAMSGQAAAGGNGNLVIVAGRGKGGNGYEIHTNPGGTIKRAPQGDQKDVLWPDPLNGRTGEGVTGSVWHWNVDAYRYTGGIDKLLANGSVAFHFPNGAFENDECLVVGGESSGKTHYNVGSQSANISLPAMTTENLDWDGRDSSSEDHGNPETAGGQLSDNGVDVLTSGPNDPVHYVKIDGHATFQGYDPGGSAGYSNSSNKQASIVYSYMGDGPFTTFFQNLANLKPAQRGYHKNVLLKHKNLSWGSQLVADEVKKPTRQNFENTVRSLAEDGYTIDLYIMSHGKRDSFKMSTGSFGSEDWYKYGDIERLRASFEGDIDLRMVYQCNCWGSELNEAWRKLGATATAGSKYVNFFPNQFTDFAKLWKKGLTFENALKLSNTASSRAAVRHLLRLDIPQTRGDLWATDKKVHEATCAPVAVLQADGGCAKDYFTNRWQHNDSEWHNVVGKPKSNNPMTGAGGWGFVQQASDKLTAGDTSVTISR